MPVSREPGEADDIDRELEKLRGFGGTFFLALGVSGIIVALIAVLLWVVVL